ncbi:HAD family phosphatase [Thalassospira sp. MA62]|nr:HAD family phosphatase [Thalassospira sp. MA62]
MTLPAAVIFDLDGCLVDSEPISLSVIASEMQRIGIDEVTPTDIRDRYLGVSIQVICQHISERLGEACPPDFVDRVENHLLKTYETELRQIPHASALLDQLRDAGIKIALATGGSLRRMGATLSISGLAGRFANVAFSADQVTHGKPAPDLFLLAAREIGVPPTQCVVVEDSPHGIKGAKAAGMTAFGFVGGSHLADIRALQTERLSSAGADAIYGSLEELGNVICGQAR